jgi:hypothetical protein
MCMFSSSTHGQCQPRRSLFKCKGRVRVRSEAKQHEAAVEASEGPGWGMIHVETTRGSSSTNVATHRGPTSPTSLPQGVNSAFEDVAELGRCLDEAADDLPRALRQYSQKRAGEARNCNTTHWGFQEGP